MSPTRYIRCQTPAQVVAIARANHAPFTRTAYAASVTERERNRTAMLRAILEDGDS